MSLKRISLDGLILVPSSGVMLVGGLCKFVSPEFVPWLAVVGLLFPFALFVFVIGLVLRVSRGYWKGMIWPLVIVGCAYGDIGRTVGGLGGDAEVEGETELSVTSFNVRRMDEYNWIDGDETRNELFEWMEGNSADVLCLQEFPSNMEPRLRQLLPRYSVITISQTSGPAFVSNRKVINGGKWSPNGKARGLYADILVDDDTVRVVNVHLQSVGLARDDYDAVRDGTDAEDRKRLLGRLSAAYKLRADQAQKLNDFIATSPYKTILAGDFNDTPISYALNCIENMNDAFTTSGSGLGATYVGDLQGLRIDYLLYSDSISCSEFTTHNIKLSDHRPIEGKFNF